MLHCLLSAVGVKIFLKFLQREAVILRKEVFEIEDGLLGLSGSSIDLHTVAGGNDHVLLDGRNGMNPGEGFFHLILRKGQALPNLNRGRIMI
jgi:hypothetical protein